MSFQCPCFFRSTLCQHLNSNFRCPNTHTHTHTHTHLSLSPLSVTFCFIPMPSLEKIWLFPSWIHLQPTGNRHSITFFVSLDTGDEWSSLASLQFILTLWYCPQYVTAWRLSQLLNSPNAQAPGHRNPLCRRHASGWQWQHYVLLSLPSGQPFNM